MANQTSSSPCHQASDWLEATRHRRDGGWEIEGAGTITARTSDAELEAMAERIYAAAAAEGVVLKDLWPHLQFLRIAK